jgi:hypothetical protein
LKTRRAALGMTGRARRRAAALPGRRLSDVWRLDRLGRTMWG